MLRARSEKMPFALADHVTSEVEREMVESLARRHASLVEGWKPAQAAAVAAFRASRTQQKAATRLRVTQQAVSQALKSAHVRDLMLAEAALRDWLAMLNPSDPDNSVRGRPTGVVAVAERVSGVGRGGRQVRVDRRRQL